MQRLLAVLLVLIGLIGLALGRLGETTWAPATETTAAVDLADPGSALVIDPGVLYVGGEEGEAVIEGASDVSVITAANGDIEAYLEDTRYTRVTGASDWTTLSTQEVNPDGEAELSDPTSSDLWRSVDTEPSPYTLDIADFRAGDEENGDVYRSLLIVTDGSEPAAQKLSITWPVDDENEWVPFAYAGGAAIAVIGLVLLVVSLGGRRRDEDEQLEEAEEPREPVGPAPAAATASAAGAAASAPGASGAAAADADAESADADAESDADTAAEPGVDAVIAAEESREQSVWALGETPSESPTDDAPATEEDTGDALGAEGSHEDASSGGAEEDAPAEGSDEDAPAEAPADPDRTEQLRPIDDEEQR